MFAEYSSGKRPSLIECGGSAVATFVDTLCRPSFFASLARHLPSSAADKFLAYTLWSTVAMYLGVRVLVLSFGLTNGISLGDLLIDGTRGLQRPLGFPSSYNVLRALPYGFAEAGAILIGLFWIRRRCLVKFKNVMELEDAKRLFAYSFPWLAWIVLSWSGGLVGAVIVNAYTQRTILAQFSWLLVVSTGVLLWPRRLSSGIQTLSASSASVSESRNLAGGCVAETIKILFICVYLVGPLFKWPIVLIPGSDFELPHI